MTEISLFFKEKTVQLVDSSLTPDEILSAAVQCDVIFLDTREDSKKNLYPFFALCEEKGKKLVIIQKEGEQMVASDHLLNQCVSLGL